MSLPRIGALVLALTLAVPAATAFARRPARVVVNRVALSPTQVNALSRAFRTPIQPGRYWYDRVSGAWGMEGGPMQGLLPPNLNVGGKLQRNASHGRTGVIVNGRELHAYDVQRLRRAGVPVRRGRFWLNHRGVGGYEGQPASFDLSASLRARRPKRKSVLTTWDKTGVAVYPQ